MSQHNSGIACTNLCVEDGGAGVLEVACYDDLTAVKVRGVRGLGDRGVVHLVVQVRDLYL